MATGNVKCCGLLFTKASHSTPPASQAHANPPEHCSEKPSDGGCLRNNRTAMRTVRHCTVQIHHHPRHQEEGDCYEYRCRTEFIARNHGQSVIQRGQATVHHRQAGNSGNKGAWGFCSDLPNLAPIATCRTDVSKCSLDRSSRLQKPTKKWLHPHSYFWRAWRFPRTRKPQPCMRA